MSENSIISSITSGCNLPLELVQSATWTCAIRYSWQIRHMLASPGLANLVDKSLSPKRIPLYFSDNSFQNFVGTLAIGERTSIPKLEWKKEAWKKTHHGTW